MNRKEHYKHINAEIQKTMQSGESIKDFYRFAAQNPHIPLRNACQIVVSRPSALISYSFEEWNAMGRRIHRGSKGVKYYDEGGNKKFVFSEVDTHGDARYLSLMTPMRKMLDGFSILNGNQETTGAQRDEYAKIYANVTAYLIDNDYLTDDKQKNLLLCEGVAYSLYCKTDAPQNDSIKIRGMPYSLQDNAQVFKDIYAISNLLNQEIEKAYLKQAEQAAIRETAAPDKQSDIVIVQSAVRSNYKGYDAFVKRNEYPPYEEKVYLGKDENYDNHGNYDNSDNSLVLISNNPDIYYFLYGNGYVKSQQEMLEHGLTDKLYAEFNELQSGILKQFEQTRQIKFSIDISVEGSGTPFAYPYLEQEKPAPQADEPIPQEPEKPKPTVTPFYKKYLDEQEKYPNAVIVMRLGDFYEIMGENAVTVSSLLDLTLTGRGVGVSDRVPMCGFPFHAKDRYLEKITESLDVVVVEDKKENVFIKSRITTEIENEVKPSEDEQDFEGFSDEDFDEFVNEFIDEFDKDNSPPVDEKNESGNDGQFLDREDEQDFEDEDEQNEDSFDEDEQDFDEENDESDNEEKGKQPQENNSPKKEKERKSIRDRNGKKKVAQPSFFDLFDEPKDKTPQEKLIEYILQRGSGFANGKFRIYEQYFSDPTVKEYADFLKDEYGTGGYGDSVYGDWHDSKGITMELRDKENPENNIVVKLNWTQVATQIADLIDNDNYFIGNEKQRYEQWKAEKDGKQPVITPLSENDLPPKTAQTETVPAADNTDLSELELDSSELGGAKARFRSNVEAIKLVNGLFAQNRTPSTDEKKVLAKYVGWGGIPQVFDEHNESWQKEYAELKSLLSTEDYDRAKGSVLNAHYTSKEVIEGIYKALDRFGVKGNNRILEPAMGTGNFYGYMPKEIAENAKLYGVELDNITGRIAQKLYPNVNVQIKGFEQTTFPNNHFDVVVSNVPFGNYSVYDTEYSKHNFNIHDYFIAKGIDKLKPNGIMAVITSKGTLDKLNPSVRKHIADRAELLGAIRLPNTAFRQSAGTQVTTDILFFQKRDEIINANDEWISTGGFSIEKDGAKQDVKINSYFAARPEMMLGTLVQEHGLYGALDITLNSDGRNLSDALTDAIERLPKDIYKNPEFTATEEKQETEVDYDLKPLCLKAINGKLYMRVGEEMVEQPVPKIPSNAYERIAAMIELREGLRHVLDIQSNGCSDEVLKEEQRKLNAKYDRFVRFYGYVNSQTNTKLFKEDGDSALLFASENLSEDKKTAEKADIFSKRTIRPYSQITHTDDCFEALQISKNEKGKVDIAFIEELTKKDYDTILTELDTAIFRNPYGIIPEDKYSGFETAEEYLSGEVVKKLKVAEQFVRLEKMPDFERNIKALTEVQPAPIKASEISARLGASWINKSYYHQFICELMQVNHYSRDGIELFYNPHDSSWKVNRADYLKWQTQMNANQVYGTERASAYRLFEDSLNLKATQIYDTVEEDGKTKRVLNHNETVAAREKQSKIKEAFKEWIFKDPERREDLENTYNGLFNQIRLPSYDGSYLKFPQMNPAIELKDHQKDAIHRTITSGNTLLHHVVGAGKTYTVCATAMKLRQYGLAKKPMVVVPNHLVQQWANEFRTLYPTANLLIASKEDLEKENRQRFVSKVAMGDWDAVIIAQSSFSKIPISDKRQADKIREEISLIEETIDNLWDEGVAPRGAVKNLERTKKNKEALLKKLMDGDKKDSLLNFESLGVDHLFVDEAHHYKNLFLYTKMNNMAGISTAASQRASDLQLKAEYINELHGGDKGVVFATGTPISNSMTEMYTMQTYLQKQTLQRLGITYFDGWAADFGETITSLEMAPSGKGYKAKTRFAKFTNLPELLTLYRSFADVKTADMIKLNVPIAERNVINLKPSDTVIELAEQIAERAEKIGGGGVDPSIDNMLKITSDGKKLALDARCFDILAADEPTSKLNECANNVFEIWEDSQEKQGTQLVFCDLSTPKKAFEDYEYGKDFDVYNDLKYKLVQKGIPENEIAFIHDANSDLQKQTLFNSVNDGKVRVLIGSTEKCGSGTNVQKRLVALHHLDTPYRPSDLQQRDGRIIRQGNPNERVQIFTYVTERTFDSYSYQILENKSRFISQIDRGDLTVREAEDIDETTLSYAEIKAITAANPKIKRKMEVDTEVARLRILEGQYNKNLYGLQDKIRKDYPEQIRKQNLYLERTREDIKTLKQNYNPDVFSISVLGTVYTDKKDGGKALMDAFTANKTDTVVAEFAGFKLSLDPLVMLTDERSITIKGAGEYTLSISMSASGTLTRLDNFFEDFPTREKRVEQKLLQLSQDLETAKEQVTKSFEHTEQLKILLSEQTLLNAELDLNKHEEVIIDDNNDNDEDEESEENAPRKELPEAKTAVKTRRKAISTSLHKTYKEQQAKAPDAYIFALNGTRYELVGEQAKQLAKDFGLPLTTQELNNESLSVVSLEADKLDKVISKLVDKGNQVRVIEPLIREEEKTINNEKTLLFPDYAVNEDTRQDFADSSDMLPLRRRSAERLHELGFEIYKLFPDADTPEKVRYGVFNHNGYYGVNKDGWNKFLETDKAIEYLSARRIVAEAASTVANDDLSYVDESFTIDFINSNSDEETALREYLSDKTAPNNEDIKGYLPDLITEFTKRISGSYLDHYGWDEGGVKRAIIEHIADEELKSYIRFEDIAKNGLMIKSQVEGFDDWSTKTLPPAAREAAEWLILNGFDNESDVLSAFYDRQTSSMSDDIYTNAEESDNAKIVRVAEKYRQSAAETNSETEHEKEKSITVLIRRAGQEPTVETIENSLKAQQQIVGGHIEMPYNPEFSKGLHIICNDVGKFVSDPEPNVHWGNEDVLFGDILFVGIDSEGETISLTPKQIDEAKKWVADNDASEFKGNAVDLAKTEFYTDFDNNRTKESVKKELDEYLDGMELDDDWGDIDEITGDFFVDWDDENDILAWADFVREVVREHFKEPDQNAKTDFDIDQEIETMLDNMTAEEIDELINPQTKESVESTQKIPLYKQSFAYARENGELEQCRASLEENRICVTEIDKAIRANFDGAILAENIEKPLIEKFGFERINYVLASTVQYYNYDGRYSRENKEWANGIDIYETDSHIKDSFILRSHPAIADLFVTNVREQFNETANIKEEKLEEKKYIPIYTQSFTYAQEHGEIDEYRASRKENRTCKEETEKAIRENWKDNHLEKGFETALIEKFGIERMSYVLANTLQDKEWDARFSKQNKEWARTIFVYEDKENRSNFVVDTHSVLTDAFVDRFREAMKQPQEKKEEKPIENTETKGTETPTPAKEKTNWLKVNIAKEALIKQYDDSSFMRMPSSKPEYADYTYNLYNSRIKESTQIYDLQSDSREPCYQVLFKETDNVRLSNKNKETITLSAREFLEVVGGTTSKDYTAKKTDEKQWFSINMPDEAVVGKYDNVTLLQLPKDGVTAGFSYYIPNNFVRDEEGYEDNRITVRLPDDFEITAKNKDKQELKLSAFQLFEFCNDTEAAEYTAKKSADSGKENGGWTYFGMNTGAKIADYENRTLFKMPKGDYENFFYYLPNKFVKEDGEKETLQFSLPNDLVIKLSDNKNGEKVDLSVEQFLKEVKDKTNADYNSNFQKPSEGKTNAFAAREKEFADKIPDEMKERPNWCIVRTKENADTGRLEKYIINCYTGKFAESDNPDTWTDFKTACEYAKKNGGETLAYALDGKDKICCIDLDRCKDENGNLSDLAVKLMLKSKGTYMENSISGKGIHVFGKTDGMDIRTFAKDGDLEFYQKTHFIAMTGDVVNNSKGLVNLDNTEVKGILESKCAKRTELKGMGLGVEGLSVMTDRDVVEKAISSKGGDKFQALYNGQDLQNNKSNSDMSLMNRLAFWCNADKEQMLRVFATSGLYRKEKSPDYYEGTAIKAIRDTSSRYQAQISNTAKPSEKKPNGNGNGGNGKA